MVIWAESFQATAYMEELKLDPPMVQHLSLEERAMVQDALSKHHNSSVASHQCCSMLIQIVRAPVSVVWSIVRRFDTPQLYKHFISSCACKGDLRVGSTREVVVVSGLPAKNSTERLEILDDEEHILSFRVLGGDHRLQNYRSVTTLHECMIDSLPGTLVVESYVVDVPEGNTKEDTRIFTNTLVKCNLQSLAHISEKISVRTERQGDA